MSDTFFTAPAHWHWLVVLYFFLGGISGGSYALAAFVTLFGRGAHRTLERVGYHVAFLALLPCPALLIADLDRPERFWHLFWMSQRGGPMFKWWAPISIGSWALLAFGLIATLSLLAIRGEDHPSGSLFAPLRRGIAGKVIAVLGGFFALFVAGYTGVLLSVTNRPIWADTPLLGLLFVLSSAATSSAVLLILLRRTETASRAWLERMERASAALELGALALLVVWLGPISRVWFGVWGLALLGFALGGIVMPLVIARRAAVLASALLVAGGLVLRAVIVLSSEAIPKTGV